MEIVYGVEKTGMSLPEHLRTLKEAGLGSIPGTAAEILDDDVRQLLSPNKLKVRQWIAVIRTAHELGIPTTSTMMYGHAELPEHWVRHILLLREIQMDTGGFTEFVPLGFIHSQTRLFRTGRARAGSSFEEHLLVHALARLLLNGHIKNIQVSWVKLGFEASLACLEAGANDFGGTLMEESISKSAGANFRGICLAGRAARVDPDDWPYACRAHHDLQNPASVRTRGCRRIPADSNAWRRSEKMPRCSTRQRY